MEGEEFESFTINRQYARKYEEKKRREELSKLRDRYGDDYEPESSSSEEEDDNAQALTADKERDFLRTLSLLKAKDPKVYDPSLCFFKEDEDDADEDEDGGGAAKSEKAADNSPVKKSKPVYLRDYEMQQLQEHGSKAFVSDSDNDDSDLERKRAAEDNHMLYNQEMRDLKEGFLNQSDDIVDDDDKGDWTVGGVLAPRKKDKKSEKKLEDSYRKFIQDEDMEGEAEVEEHAKKDLEPLKRFWNDPNLDEGERFLRDYILNQGYRDKESDDIPTYGELVGDDEEDEEAVEEQEQFERKYNFRFEEPDAEFVKSYPRTTASVRKPDDSRREKRKAREERKQVEKEEREAELKRLKKLKRKEIQQKLSKIEEITGVGIDVDKIDLDGDFDASVYDQAMQNAFGSDYYEVEEEEKPIFSDLEDGSEEDDASEPEEVAAVTCDAHVVAEHGDEECYGEGDEEDFNMDADYEVGIAKSKKQLKRERRRRKPGGADAEELPAFDPNEKSIQEYLEEYFKLDYEDMIGDTKCRFKYREVLPNSFGLSTEEILTCEDRELNSWVSLKKSVQYRADEEEKTDLRKYKKRAREGKRKRRILASLYKPATQEKEDSAAVSTATEAEAEATAEAATATEAPPLCAPTPAGKRKHDGHQPDAGGAKESDGGSAAKSEPETGKQKKAKKHAQYAARPVQSSSVADSRKALFGIDPNKTNRQRRKKKRKQAAASQSS